jgi:hypothetical protein
VYTVSAALPLDQGCQANAVPATTTATVRPAAYRNLRGRRSGATGFRLAILDCVIGG